MPKYHYSLDGYLWHKLPCMREPNDNSVVFFTCSGAMSWLQHQMEFWIMKRQSDKMWVVRFWGTSIEYLSDTFSRWQRRSFVFLALCLYKSVRPFPAVGQFIIRLKTSLAIPPRVQFVRVVFICGHGVDSSFIHPLCWVCLGMTQDVWFLNKSVVLTFWFSVWWWQEYHVAYSLCLGLINFSEGLAVESTYEKVFGWSPLFSLFWD